MVVSGTTIAVVNLHFTLVSIVTIPHIIILFCEPKEMRVFLLMTRTNQVGGK